MRIGQLTRRDFLKTAGIGLAANAVAPAVHAFGESGLPHRPLKIGLLLPTAYRYPLLSDNFVAGLKTYLRQTNHQTDLRIASFSLDQVVASAEKLIQTEQVDLVISLNTANLAERLRAIFERAGILLLVADVGANAIRVDETSPAIIYNSLNLWQSSWAIAAKAVQQFGQRMFTAASFYDSGYDSLYAAQLGAESAGGSQVEAAVTHVLPGNNGLAATLESIRAAQPDFVFAHYSGQEAVEFLDAYAAAGLTSDIPLVTSAFALHDHTLAALGGSLVGIQSGLVWSNTLNQPTNNDFTAAFQHLNGSAADPFAVLGYDSAHLIDQAIQTTGSVRADRLAQALRSTQIDSPRGTLAFDAELQSFSSSTYQGEVRYHGLSAQNMVVATFDPVPAQEVLPQFSQNDHRTGWLNPYLSL